MSNTIILLAAVAITVLGIPIVYAPIEINRDILSDDPDMADRTVAAIESCAVTSTDNDKRITLFAPSINPDCWLAKIFFEVDGYKMVENSSGLIIMEKENEK